MDQPAQTHAVGGDAVALQPASQNATPRALQHVRPSEEVVSAQSDVRLLNRVAGVLQEMNAGRIVSDHEVLQHEADCRRLCETAHARFEETHNPCDRDEAVLWLARADEARRSLSPAFKAAREAEIMRSIAEGTGCFFMDQGDTARAHIKGRANG